MHHCHGHGLLRQAGNGHGHGHGHGIKQAGRLVVHIPSGYVAKINIPWPWPWPWGRQAGRQARLVTEYYYTSKQSAPPQTVTESRSRSRDIHCGKDPPMVCSSLHTVLHTWQPDHRLSMWQRTHRTDKTHKTDWMNTMRKAGPFAEKILLCVLCVLCSYA